MVSCASARHVECCSACGTTGQDGRHTGYLLAPVVLVPPYAHSHLPLSRRVRCCQTLGLGFAQTQEAHSSWPHLQHRQDEQKRQ